MSVLSTTYLPMRARENLVLSYNSQKWLTFAYSQSDHEFNLPTVTVSGKKSYDIIANLNLTSHWRSDTKTHTSEKDDVTPRLIDFVFSTTLENKQGPLSKQSAVHESQRDENGQKTGERSG